MFLDYKNYRNVWNFFLILVFFLFSASPYALEPKNPRSVFNQEYDAVLLGLIQKAKVSIYASHFTFSTQEDICNEIVQSLREAAKRGVAVKLFLEGKKKGAKDKNIKAEKILKEAGIQVVLNASRRVAHAKLFVVDEEWVLSGSTNISHSSMKNNNEANLLLKSPQIAQTLQKYIKSLMENSDREIVVESKAENQIQAITDKSFFSYALDMIQNAQKELCITTYLFDYMPDAPDSNISKLFQALVQAHKRGVKIRIFLEQSSFHFNEHIHEKNLESAQFLYSQGIEGIRFDKPNQISHSKIILSDQKKALLGSTNWYCYDIDLGHQVNFIIEEKNILAQLAEYFDSLYSAGVTSCKRL